MNNAATKITPKINYVLSADVLATATQKSIDTAAIVRQNFIASHSVIDTDMLKQFIESENAN